MKKTRVEHFKEYREEISKIPDGKKDIVDDEVNKSVDSSAYSHMNQDRLRQHDEYTIMMSNTMLQEKKNQEEKERKKALKKKILYASLFTALAVITLTIIILIIVFLSSN